MIFVGYLIYGLLILLAIYFVQVSLNITFLLKLIKLLILICIFVKDYQKILFYLIKFEFFSIVINLYF